MVILRQVALVMGLAESSTSISLNANDFVAGEKCNT